MQRTLRFLHRAAPVAALGLTVAACGGLKDDLGLSKEAPDEFAVVRNAPLSLPPDFNLRPPRPGEVGDGRVEQRDQARSLLVGGRGAGARTAAAAELASSQSASISYSFLPGRAGQSLGELSEYRLVATAPGAGGGLSGGLGRGEMALLGRLNAANTDPNIRLQVDQEAAVLAADDRNVVERLMFWRELAEPGTVVDPTGESKRINENSALGRPVTDGETPEIKVERLSSGIKLF